MSQQSHRASVEKATQSVLAAQSRVNPRFRQRYHFMAPAYWLNDPNGLIQYKGQYHLFYQHNPYEAVWGPMHWGHAVSTDLLHWTHLPVALAPSEEYEQGDGGCFSGSAVEKDGQMVLFYTGTRTDGAYPVQAQCIAVSDDGLQFDKYTKNPVAELPGEAARDFRDPKVFRHGDRWYMVTVTCKNNSGMALLYESEDLFDWRYKGVLADGKGKMGRVWECPDYFELSGKGVLLFSPVEFEDRKASYLTGNLNYETGALKAEVLGESDWGFDFYAAQSFEDVGGRRIMIGWANGWDWMPWWNGFGPTIKDLWCGYMSLPRTVSLCKDGRLAFAPVEELKNLRGQENTLGTIILNTGEKLQLQAGDGISFELVAEFDLKRTTATRFGLQLRRSENEKTVVECNLESKNIIFDRSASDGYSTGIKRCPLESFGGDTLHLHIFSDTCSVEIFTDGGRTVLSSSIYPQEKSNGICLYAEDGEVFVNRVQSWGIAL